MTTNIENYNTLDKLGQKLKEVSNLLDEIAQPYMSSTSNGIRKELELSALLANKSCVIDANEIISLFRTLKEMNNSYFHILANSRTSKAPLTQTAA